ncbi:MAG TPA: hypothetical protein VLA19_03420 [Herpetosiphonaceae bacterium]|nr:hypothetical protein [Herpetosiphonaceae bacterium]
MSDSRVLICRVDDPASAQMTELAAFDLPAADVSTLQPETALDELETTTQETGNAILHRALQAQWNIIDAELTEQHRQHFPPRWSTSTAMSPSPLRAASASLPSVARSVLTGRRRPT